ncbi:hypothetical protein Tco_0510275 [Tanacetum coccineum]
MAAEPQLLEAAGMVMMAVGDGVRCGGVDGGCGVAAAERGGSGDDVWRGCDGWGRLRRVAVRWCLWWRGCGVGCSRSGGGGRG